MESNVLTLEGMSPVPLPPALNLNGIEASLISLRRYKRISDKTVRSILFRIGLGGVGFFCALKAYRLSEVLALEIYFEAARGLLRHFLPSSTTLPSCSFLRIPRTDVRLIPMIETMEDVQITSRGQSNGSGRVKRARTELTSTESEAQIRRRNEAQKEYGRGKKIHTKSIRDKKLRGNLKALESKYKDATLKAKDAEILHENVGGELEPETELERTYKISQSAIKKSVAVQTAQMGSFQLKMAPALGPYMIDYTRNGRHMLVAGRKGYVATMDWREPKLGCELQLGETVRDAIWLNNNQRFAVAQKKYVYIYDQAGVEIHCLKKHIEVTNMEFLPYHYLLATVVSRFTDKWLGF